MSEKITPVEIRKRYRWTKIYNPGPWWNVTNGVCLQKTSKYDIQICDVQCTKLSYFSVFRRLFITGYWNFETIVGPIFSWKYRQWTMILWLSQNFEKKYNTFFPASKKSKLDKKLSHHQTISHQAGRNARTLEPGELITSITIRTVQCGNGPGTQKPPPLRPLLKVTRISLLRIRKMANLCRKTGKWG